MEISNVLRSQITQSRVREKLFGDDYDVIPELDRGSSRFAYFCSTLTSVCWWGGFSIFLVPSIVVNSRQDIAEFGVMPTVWAALLVTAVLAFFAWSLYWFVWVWTYIKHFTHGSAALGAIWPWWVCIVAMFILQEVVPFDFLVFPSLLVLYFALYLPQSAALKATEPIHDEDTVDSERYKVAGAFWGTGVAFRITASVFDDNPGNGAFLHIYRP